MIKINPRNLIEKNRRNHMKTLCFNLSSLIPSTHFKTSKDTVSQQDQLDVAACYIKQLKERIDNLKATKEQLATIAGGSKNYYFPLVVVELIDMGSSLEVVLITGPQRNFMLYEVIAILEEEGAHVLIATFSTLGDKIFHTLHAQVKISRVGVETSRVSQRLHDLVY